MRKTICGYEPPRQLPTIGLCKDQNLCSTMEQCVVKRGKGFFKKYNLLDALYGETVLAGIEYVPVQYKPGIPIKVCPFCGGLPGNPTDFDAELDID